MNEYQKIIELTRLIQTEYRPPAAAIANHLSVMNSLPNRSAVSDLLEARKKWIQFYDAQHYSVQSELSKNAGIVLTAAKQANHSEFQNFISSFSGILSKTDYSALCSYIKSISVEKDGVVFSDEIASAIKQSVDEAFKTSASSLPPSPPATIPHSTVENNNDSSMKISFSTALSIINLVLTIIFQFLPNNQMEELITIQKSEEAILSEISSNITKLTESLQEVLPAECYEEFPSSSDEILRSTTGCDYSSPLSQPVSDQSVSGNSLTPDIPCDSDRRQSLKSTE